MSFLGSFLLGQTVTFGITWTPDVGQPAITGSALTLTHDESGTVMGPLAATGAGNVWSASAQPTKKGNWTVGWTTSPAGGITHDEIYIS